MQVGGGAPVVYQSIASESGASFSPIQKLCEVSATHRASAISGNDPFYTSLRERLTHSPPLYLFCSGGRGHRSAKEALVEEALHPVYTQMREEYPRDTRCQDFSSFLSYCTAQKWISELDVLQDCLGYLGKWFSQIWNWALRNENRKIIHCLVGLQGLFDCVYGLIIFVRVLWVLWKKNISHVISTQPLGFRATLWAIRTYNYWLKDAFLPPTGLSLYLTDFPSKGASHFLRPIQDLSEGEKNLLHLNIPCPRSQDLAIPHLLSHFSAKKIQFLRPNHLPVRRVFRIPPLFHPQSAEHTFFCMLGSSPHLPTLLSYLSLFQHTAAKYREKNWHLFLYKGENVSVQLERQAALSPTHLRVTLLGPQSAEQLSSLFWHCHTITRAGGGTLMELLSIEYQRQQAHLPPKWRDIHTEHALHEVPPWEKENASVFPQGLMAGQSRLVSPSTYAVLRLEQM